MAKNRLFIALIFLLVTVLFSSAAICNRCTITDIDDGGAPSDQEVSGGQNQETPGGSSPDERSGDTIPGGEGDANGDNDETTNSAPVIDSIELWGSDIGVLIEDGTFDAVPSETRDLPFIISAYDEDGDEISYFLEDTLGNSFEVNKIENDLAEALWSAPIHNGSYSLTFRVSDTAGTEDSFVLDMTILDIEENGVIPEEPEESEGDDGEDGIDSPFGSSLITADGGISGYVTEGEMAYPGSAISIGDNESDQWVKGYITFYIDGLSEVNVRYVAIDISGINKTGDPSAVSSRLDIKAFDYGSSLDAGDYALGGTPLISTDTESVQDARSFSFTSESSESLISTLQEAVNGGSGRYQLKLGLASGTDSDGQWDTLVFHASNVVMEVNFER